jgi:uncharacterized delta-60 repeat protein
VTPTPTISMTASVTPSISLTPSTSLTPSVTVSPQLSPTPSVTPSLTPPVQVNSLIQLNSDGTYNTSTPMNHLGDWMVQTADNNIYLAGSFTSIGGNSYNNFCRLTSAGAVDTTFTDIGLNSTFQYDNGIIQLSSGDIYLGGNFTAVDGNTYNGLCRLTSTGTLDTTFTNIAFTGGAADIRGLLASSDGNIWVVGEFNTVNGASRPSVARLTSTGALDTSVAAWSNTGGGVPYKMWESADNHLYMTGNQTNVNGQGYEGLTRLNLSDGSVDTTFTDLAISGNVFGFCQIFSGDIYITGGFTSISGNTATGMARLNSDGTYDSTYTLPTFTGGTPLRIIQTADSNIYVVGTFTQVNGYSYPGIVRFNSSGVLDTTFAPINISQSNLLLFQAADGYIYTCSGTY